jgi:hypothetical protein
MAEVKFGKGSEEWLMFMDYWNLCQKHWQVEHGDAYWEQLIDDTNRFFEKYKSIELARHLTLALVDTQEILSKK